MQVHALPKDALHGKSIFLKGPEAKHIVRVLRHGPGDEIVFSDGEGRLVHAVLDRVQGTELHAEVSRIEDDPREAGAPRGTLALSLLKGDHFELALEKCVELGIHRIQPLLANHSVVKWKGNPKKLDRWRRIAESAMKQAGRSWLPEVREPVSVQQLLESLPSGKRLIVADETERENSVMELKTSLADGYVACVGPEGAFDDTERAALAAANAEVVSLSSFVLRAETAAVVLIAALEDHRLRRS